MQQLEYAKTGDYFYPTLVLNENSSVTIGKYGLMRKHYLRMYRPILWNQMILQETLIPHLQEIDETAHQRMDRLMSELMNRYNVTEALKATDPMKWTRVMNGLRVQAEETILVELIYC